MAGSVPKRGLRRFTRRSARAPLRSHCHRGQVVPPQRSRRAFRSQPTPAPPAQATKVGHLRHRWPPPGAASISSIRTRARDDAFLNSQITSPNMRLFTQPLTYCSAVAAKRSSHETGSAFALPVSCRFGPPNRYAGAAECLNRDREIERSAETIFRLSDVVAAVGQEVCARGAAHQHAGHVSDLKL